MRMIPWFAAGALAATVTAGCASPRGDTAAAFTHVDSAGIAIVTNFGITNRGDYALDDTPVTVIGNNSADSNQQFRRAPLAIRLPTGVVITAPQEGSVSAFDRNGKFIRTLARRGRGPDELTSVSRLMVVADTLIIRGGRRLRFSVTDLSPLPEIRIECPRGAHLWEGNAQCAPEFFSDGWAITIAGDSTIPRTATNRPNLDLGNDVTSPGPGHLRQFSRIYAIPPARDTAYPLGLFAGIEQSVIPLGDGQAVAVIHPFYSFRSFYASNGNPRRFVVALNPDYNIEVWNDRGILTQLIRRTNGRRVPTDADRTEVPKFIAIYLEDRITAEKALSLMSIPDSLPAFGGLAVTPRGAVIVQTAGWRASESLSLFDVFDEEGVWVAEWKLPRRARIVDIGNDYILYTRLDEDDVPLVEVRKYKASSHLKK